MSESDSSTSWVHLGVVKPELVNAPGGLGGEGLVQLVDVDVVGAESGLLQTGWDGVGWADSHDIWGNSDDGVGDELADNVESLGLGDRSSGEEDGGSSVGGLGGVSGGGDSGLLERWLELGELGGGGTGSDSVVLGDNNCGFAALLVDSSDGDWDDLVIEPALLLSVEGSSLGLGGELVKNFSLEVVLLGDILDKNK